MATTTRELVLDLINFVFSKGASFNRGYSKYSKNFPTLEERIDATIENIDTYFDNLPDLLLSEEIEYMLMYSEKEKTYRGFDLNEIQDFEDRCHRIFYETFDLGETSYETNESITSKIVKYFQSKGKLLYREDLARQIVSNNGLLRSDSLSIMPDYIKDTVGSLYESTKGGILPQELLDQIVLNYLVDELLFEYRREYREVSGGRIDIDWEKNILGYYTALHTCVDDE